MVIPFEPDTLFEINQNVSVEEYTQGVFIIDSIYKNYNDILSILQNMPVPNWKKEKASKNFVDYYDCRPMIRVSFPTDKSMAIHNFCGSIIGDKYDQSGQIAMETKMYEFNFFKNIKENISSDLQHMPHRDYKYAALVYLDNVASGGTALYDNSLHIESNEGENIFYDVSNIEKTVIPAKPNRMVIFDGTKLHGGYIENHNDYVNSWRINQPIFFEPV